MGTDLLIKIQELREQATQYALKNNFKKARAIQKEEIALIKQLEIENNLVWNYDYWVTEVCGEVCDSLEEARQNFLDKVSKLNGVKVIDGSKGVKLIEVISSNKIYQYTIHAHYTSVKIGEEKGIDLWGKECVKDIYTTKCYACVDKNIFNAYRDKYFY